MYKNLLFEVRDRIGFVTLNRPSALNALDSRTLEELRSLFESIAQTTSVQAVILTGSGRSFVAGADLHELKGLSAVDGRGFALAGQETFDRIEKLGKPVIAAVNGHALGGGCELALACTLRIASERAVFGQPEVKLGLIPGFGGSQRLTRLIGPGRGLGMLLTGDLIDANHALEMGLVNQVVAHSELMPVAESMARKILSNAPLAVAHCLEAAQAGLESSLAGGLQLEAALFGLCCATEDMREGIGAFLEKREAKFEGK